MAFFFFFSFYCTQKQRYFTPTLILKLTLCNTTATPTCTACQLVFPLLQVQNTILQKKKKNLRTGFPRRPEAFPYNENKYKPDYYGYHYYTRAHDMPTVIFPFYKYSTSTTLSFERSARPRNRPSASLSRGTSSR